MEEGDVHSKTTARYGRVHVRRVLPSCSSVRETRSRKTPEAPAASLLTSTTTFQSGRASTVSRFPAVDWEMRDEEKSMVPG